MDPVVLVLGLGFLASLVFNICLGVLYKSAADMNDQLLDGWNGTLDKWKETNETNGRLVALNEELLSMLDRKKKFRELVEQGKNNEEIARDLSLPVSTVRHIRAEL